MKTQTKYWNEQMETLDTEGFQRIQEKALLRQLDYVWKNSEFYQQKFSKAGAELKDIRSIEDLSKLPFAVSLSQQARRIIRQNVALSLGIKALFLALAVSGAATLWMAVFADVGASLIVTLNGMRLLRRR